MRIMGVAVRAVISQPHWRAKAQTVQMRMVVLREFVGSVFTASLKLGIFVQGSSVTFLLHSGAYCRTMSTLALH